MFPVGANRRPSVDNHMVFRRGSLPGPNRAEDVDHGPAGRRAMVEAAPYVRPKHEHPIHFLRWHPPTGNSTEGGHYELAEEAAAILNSLEGPAAVVAVAEISGTGTQFVVRRFLNFPRDFPAGHPRRRERGVWMWVRERADDYVLVLDFEGLDVSEGDQQRQHSDPGQSSQLATKSHAHHTALLFSLAVLLSSSLMLLTEDILSTPDIAKLGFITEIVTDVCDHFGEPHSYRPDLTWVLTNCTMSLFGGEAADERIERELKSLHSTGSELDPRSQRINELKTWIDQLFPNRALIALPPPGAEAEKGISAFPIWEELKLEYRVQMIKVNRRVFSSPQYKRVPIPDGESAPLSGPDFVRLTRICINALRTKKPSALLGKTVEPWKVFHGELENAEVELVLHQYEEHMSKLTPPVPVEELRVYHRRGRQQILDNARKLAMMRSKAVHLLEQILQGRFRCYERRNRAAILQKCQALCREAYDKHFGSGGSPTTDFPTASAAFLKDFNAATASLTQGDDDLQNQVQYVSIRSCTEIQKLEWELREAKLAAAVCEEKWRETESRLNMAFAEVTGEAEQALAKVSRSAAARIRELVAQIEVKDRRIENVDEEARRFRHAAEGWEATARAACAKAEEAEAERNRLVLLYEGCKNLSTTSATLETPRANQSEGPVAPS